MTAEGEADDHTFRMFCFGIHCLQLFSGKYLFLEARQYLHAEVTNNVLLQRKRSLCRIQGIESNSNSAFSAQLHSPSLSPSSLPQDASKTSSRCLMRYGMAVGSVLVGVLQGKCPAFDVWGKTVNLASRMEVFRISRIQRHNNIECHII